MKVYGKILLLCVFHPDVWGTAAFLSQAPKELALKGAQTTDALTTCFLSVKDAYKVAAIRDLKEGDVSVKAASKIKNTLPVEIVDENRRKALEARLATLEASGRLATFEKGQSSALTQVSGPYANQAKKMLDKSTPVTVYGGSRMTWSLASPYVERVQVLLQTEGRPLNADIELWRGPYDTPQKVRVYIEDGSMCPFIAVIETPRSPNTIAIRNTGQQEFPLAAHVVVDDRGPPGPSNVIKSSHANTPRNIQGGALRTYSFHPSVKSAQVFLKTDGGPLNARIELLQGPTDIKQVIEMSTEDGMNHPFFAVIETPGSGNVVRVINTDTVVFPLTAWVEPYLVGSDNFALEAVIGGDRV